MGGKGDSRFRHIVAAAAGKLGDVSTIHLYVEEHNVFGIM